MIKTYDAAGAGEIRIMIVDDTAVRASKVGINPNTTTAALQINSQTNASGASATIDAAIMTVNAQRASFDAISNRLDSTVNNLTSISSNLQEGRGRIEDADFASETTSLAKSQILLHASSVILACMISDLALPAFWLITECQFMRSKVYLAMPLSTLLNAVEALRKSAQVAADVYSLANWK